MPSLRLLACAVLALAVAVLPARAQDASAPDASPSDASASGASPQAAPADTVGQWRYDLTGKLSASQAAYKDWQEGGINTVAFTSSVDGLAEKRGARWSHTHELRLAFGIIYQDLEGDENVRKADDQIRLQSNLRYRGNGFFRLFKPTIAGNLRTQFARGFDYENNPFPDGSPNAGDETPVQTSDFFSPAFITESIGLTYEPADWMSLRLGGASKQTVVLDEDLRVLYDVDRDKTARIEAGAEFQTSINRQIAENVRYKSTLNAFFSFNQTEDPPDVIWENVISMKVNSWLSTDLEFVTKYDKNVVDAIQIKEVLSVGISFVLI